MSVFVCIQLNFMQITWMPWINERLKLHGDFFTGIVRIAIDIILKISSLIFCSSLYQWKFIRNLLTERSLAHERFISQTPTRLGGYYSWYSTIDALTIIYDVECTWNICPILVCWPFWLSLVPFWLYYIYLLFFAFHLSISFQDRWTRNIKTPPSATYSLLYLAILC